MIRGILLHKRTDEGKAALYPQVRVRGQRRVPHHRIQSSPVFFLVVVQVVVRIGPRIDRPNRVESVCLLPRVGQTVEIRVGTGNGAHGDLSGEVVKAKPVGAGGEVGEHNVGLGPVAREGHWRAKYGLR